MILHSNLTIAKSLKLSDDQIPVENKFIAQLNNSIDIYDCLERFYQKNTESLLSLYDQLLKCQ